MLRILHVNFHMDCGGIETLLLNLHRCIDRNKLQFDYFLYGRDASYPHYYRKDIEALGGKMFYSECFKHHKYWQDYKMFGKFLDEHPEYKIVHVHTYYPTMYLWAAKKRGRITISHSHAIHLGVHTFRENLKKICVFPHRYIADYLFACSELAGIDKYGKKANAKFLRNGILTKKYTFSQDIRKAIRQSRGITSENTLVLGHVGSLSRVKNHKFLLQVFKGVHDKVPDSKLWLVGAGVLEGEIRSQVHELGLDEAVDFVGLTDKVNEYLMGMDVFVFPSLWEGLGIALIEAEASGLPCVVSEAIQNDAIISYRVSRLRLGPPPST